MNTHPSDDELLLFAYGDDPRHGAHLASCPGCRSRLQVVEQGRLLLDLGLAVNPARRPPAVWATLAVAAGLVGLMIMAGGQPQLRERPGNPWRSTLVASPVAGYVTDQELMMLDAQLRRLEQGGVYGRPD